MLCGIAFASTSAPPAQSKSSAAPLDAGSVRGHTYKNPSLGLEFTTADKLNFQAPTLKSVRGVATFVSVFSLGEARPGHSTESTVFYADALSNYAENARTTEAYLKHRIATNREIGFHQVARTAEAKLGNVSFARMDFQKGEDGGCETVFVSIRNGFAIVFAFTGDDFSAINKIIAQTRLSLD